MSSSSREANEARYLKTMAENHASLIKVILARKITKLAETQAQAPGLAILALIESILSISSGVQSKTDIPISVRAQFNRITAGELRELADQIEGLGRE